jgi:hypothetical protein
VPIVVLTVERHTFRTWAKLGDELLKRCEQELDMTPTIICILLVMRIATTLFSSGVSTILHGYTHPMRAVSAVAFYEP